MKRQSARVVAIIQARMGSTRLPGKTLADIEGKPLLSRVVERVQAARTPVSVVVATTTGPDDDAIRDLMAKEGVPVYRGSADDVLDRYYQAARASSADVVVRVTADDPFKDPEVLDAIVGYLLAHPGLDYVSNTIEPTYPEGLDVEAFTFRALETAWREAKLPSEREHVTPYIWKNPSRFKIYSYRRSEDLSGLRWTLDYEEDLAFARAVYRRLKGKGVFLETDILELLREEPELARINQGIQRNAGYLASLAKDGQTKT